MIKLLIADDHQLLLDGYIAMFEHIDDITVIAKAHNGKEVMEHLTEVSPDIILMDINMPVLNGVETCKKITKKYPDTSVIALSMYDQQSYFKRMMQYGAKGYLLKNDSAEEIEKAIREVHQGERYISSQMREHLASIEYLSGTQSKYKAVDISNREKEVLQLVSDGYTDQQIADQLYISYHTVNSHRKNLIIKLDAKNTAELIKKAMEKGFI